MIVLSHKMADNYGVPDVDNEVCNWDPYAQDAPGSFPETRRALDETAAMVIDKKGLSPTLDDINQVDQVPLRQTLMTRKERCEYLENLKTQDSGKDSGGSSGSKQHFNQRSPSPKFQSVLTVAVHDLNIPPLSGGPDDVSKSTGCIDPAGAGNLSTATSSESETSSKSVHEHTEGHFVGERSKIALWHHTHSPTAGHPAAVGAAGAASHLLGS